MNVNYSFEKSLKVSYSIEMSLKMMKKALKSCSKNPGFFEKNNRFSVIKNRAKKPVFPDRLKPVANPSMGNM